MTTFDFQTAIERMFAEYMACQAIVMDDCTNTSCFAKRLEAETMFWIGKKTFELRVDFERQEQDMNAKVRAFLREEEEMKANVTQVSNFDDQIEALKRIREQVKAIAKASERQITDEQEVEQVVEEPCIDTDNSDAESIASERQTEDAVADEQEVEQVVEEPCIDTDNSDAESTGARKTKRRKVDAADDRHMLATYIQETYIAQDKPMEMSVGELHSAISMIKDIGKTTMCRAMKELGLPHYKSNKANKFKYSIQELSDKLHGMEEHLIEPMNEHPVEPPNEHPVEPTNEHPVEPTNEHPVEHPMNEHPVEPTDEHPMKEHPADEHPAEVANELSAEQLEVEPAKDFVVEPAQDPMQEPEENLVRDPVELKEQVLAFLASEVVRPKRNIRHSVRTFHKLFQTWSGRTAPENEFVVELRELGIRPMKVGQERMVFNCRWEDAKRRIPGLDVEDDEDDKLFRSDAEFPLEPRENIPKDAMAKLTGKERPTPLYKLKDMYLLADDEEE